VHKPGRHGGSGQRLDQLGAALHRDGVYHHEEHAKALQVHAVRDRRVGHSLRPGRHMLSAAAATHPVPVMLKHPHRHLRDVMLLMREGHPQIRRRSQIRTTPTGPPRVVRQRLVRVLGPRQMCPRRATLLTLLTFHPRLTTFRLLHRRRAPRQIVRRGRHRRVPRVTRQSPLQLRDPPRLPFDRLRLRRHQRPKLLNHTSLRRYQRKQLLARQHIRLSHHPIVHTGQTQINSTRHQET